MLNILPSLFFVFFGANVEMAALSHGDIKMELTDLSYDIEDSFGAKGMDEEVYTMSEQSLKLLSELKRRNQLEKDHEDFIVRIQSDVSNRSLDEDDLSNLLKTTSNYSFHRAKSR